MADDDELGGRGNRREPDPGWIPCRSTNVSAFRYFANRMELQVRFKDGSEYRYEKVPEDVYDDLFAASSKGRFVWRVLHAFNYRRIR